MFASAPSSTFTSMTSATFRYGNLTRSLVRIFVLPSGSVSFDIAATDLDLEILWKVLNISMSSISYRSILILWAFLVCEPLLDLDLDLECLPWLGLRRLSGLLPHPSVLPLHQSESWLLLRDDLQHELKWFLKPHLWHFLPNAGQSLNWCVVLHLLHILLLRVLWLLILYEPLVLVLFLLFFFEGFDGVDGGRLCDSSVWLVTLKIFDCHLMLLCVLEQGLDMWHLLGASLSAPISWPQNAWSHGTRARFYIPHTSFSSVEYWHLSMRFLILWSNWSVDSLSPCLMSE